MSTQSTASSGGIGLGSVLFIVFLVMKLTEVIDWSWWWVTAPLWAGVAALVVLLAMMGLVLLCATVIAAVLDR